MIHIFILLLFYYSHSQIYGIRWFLDSHFSLTNIQSQAHNPHYYSLLFNTNQPFSEDVYVQIQSNICTCSHRVIQVKHVGGHQYDNQTDSNTTQQKTKVSIYRCFINNKIIGQVNYDIYTSKPVFRYSKSSNTREVYMQKKILFTSKFRSVFTSSTEPQILFFGDWGQISPKTEADKGYLPILQSVMADIQTNQNIILLIFLGDLAYDFMGEKYVSMLKYMEPITSRISVMVTPGNHDYIYHEDSFELFMQTFLSPNWQTNFNFYYSMVIGDNLFLSFNPQDYLYEANYTGNIKALDLLQKEIPPQIRQEISKKYNVIVFSHYPVYCSDPFDSIDSCDKNRQAFSAYLPIFEQLGMDLYFSGHLHLYERTHEICEKENGSFAFQQNQNDEYDKFCPIYTVEGAAGNDFFVQMETQYPKKKFSAQLVLGTGYGSLFLLQNNEITQKYKYQHYSIISKRQKQVSDTFTKNLPDHNMKQSNNLWMIMEGAIVLGIIAIFVIFLIVRMKKKKKQESENEKHVQLVEDKINPVESSIKEEPYLDKDF